MSEDKKESDGGREESKVDDLDGVNADEPTKKDIEILKTRLSERGVELKTANEKIAGFEKSDKEKKEEKEKEEKKEEDGKKE